MFLLELMFLRGKMGAAEHILLAFMSIKQLNFHMSLLFLVLCVQTCDTDLQEALHFRVITVHFQEVKYHVCSLLKNN